MNISTDTAEERYAALFEQSPVATALTRLSDRVIVNANSAFCQLFEFERDEILGRTSEELGIAPGRDVLAVEKELSAAGEVVRFECSRTTKSGTTRIVLLDVVPVLTHGERYALTKVHDITAQRRAEEGARLYEESRDRLLDLDAMERLHRVSMRFFDSDGLQGILDEVLEAAIAITESDFGNIRVFDPRSSDLTVVAARGFPEWWLDAWGHVAFGQGCCGASLERRERVIVEDVMTSPIFAAPGAREIQLRAGVRAVQATPLIDRFGAPLGTICTHYKNPGRPSDRSLRLLDLLARQAADILDRERRELEERRREMEQRVLVDVGGALSTLDFESALASVTRVATGSLADFAVIFLVEGNSARRVAAASRYAENEGVVSKLVTSLAQPRPSHPVWEVVAARRPIMQAIDPSTYESMSEGPEHLAALRTAAPRCSLFVPMLAGDSCVGAFGLTSSTRQFDDRDVRITEEIGRRCALFVENARLHERERQAIRARNDMLGIVAHELRNPLQSVVLNAMLLQQEGADAESVASISRAATRMKRIVLDLLDVAKFEAGTFEVERARIAAADLIVEIARSYRHLVGARGLEFRVDIGAANNLPFVSADKERVLQVFENLLSNAMRFTTSGGITISATPEGAEVVFCVADTGGGIAAEDLARMFDPFWRARRIHDGAGLGLSIVKMIAEAHGGRAWATSTVGAGSAFYFTLPVAAAPTPVAGTAAKDGSEQLVLIVDDDLDLRLTLARVLRRHGYAVVTASNGQGALHYLRDGQRPSVIILDLAMPVMDGWEFLSRRQRDGDLASIPVIVISGQTEASKRVVAMHADFLAKPLSPEDLVAAMGRAH
jgi:PAS domain S-box-containing protein